MVGRWRAIGKSSPFVAQTSGVGVFGGGIRVNGLRCRVRVCKVVDVRVRLRLTAATW